MDVKKLFLQLISILLIVVVVACVGTAIKRSGETDKDYINPGTNSADKENWFDKEDDTSDTQVESTEDSTQEEDSTQGSEQEPDGLRKTMPRKPHLNPNPRAIEVSGSNTRAASLSSSFSRASRRSPYLAPSAGYMPE